MNHIQLFTILLLSSLTLFGISNAYADHPANNTMTVTFDKDNYEYGETMFMDVQLVEPFTSNFTGYTTKITIPLRDHLLSTETDFLYVNASDTGFASLNYTLDSDDLQKGPFNITPYFKTYHPYHPDVPDRVTSTKHNGEILELNLNSDPRSTLLQHMKDIPSVNSTLYTMNTDTVKSIDTLITLSQNNTSNFEQIYLHLDKLSRLIEIIEETITSLQLNMTAMSNQIDKNTESINAITNSTSNHNRK